jgi:A/G-specific adenine glycosylase
MNREVKLESQPRLLSPEVPPLPVWERVNAWQSEHGRHTLPWQLNRDPYRVWLSEIMLQQTQVATVLGYFERFVARLPDVAALADALPDTVMELWSGLGYYSRARNLHRCAQIVMEQHGGAFPRSAEVLASLPGIGRSTAGAIAAFCFGERAAILDANVRRVLTRVIGFAADLARPANERALWDAATAMLPQGSPLELAERMPRYTQGLMDLGATVCLPRKPLCLLCPLAEACVARAQGHPETYPVRTRVVRRSSQSWWLLLLRDPLGRVALHKRPSPGIWAGLYCPPVFDDEGTALASLPAGASLFRADAPALHVLTHKDLYLHALWVDVRLVGVEPASGSDGLASAGHHVAEPVAADGHWESASARWATRENLDGIGVPAPVRRLLEAAWEGF